MCVALVAATGACLQGRYTFGMAKVTTMKVSTETRDRLRSLGRPDESLEDVLVSALDVYEAQQFWAAAERASALETDVQRRRRERIESATDAWMDQLR